MRGDDISIRQRVDQAFLPAISDLQKLTSTFGI